MAETRSETVVFFDGNDLPPIESGCMAAMIVTVEWKRAPGRRFTFPAYYLNRYPLEFEDGCGKPDCRACEDGDGCEVTGWFELKSHHAFDDAYFPLLGPEDKVIEWARIPGPPNG